MINFVCNYLRDLRIISCGSYSSFQVMMNEIFQNCVNNRSYPGLQISVHQSHIRSLALLSAQRLVEVRPFGFSWINAVLKAVPKLLWDQTCIFYMFDVVKYLDYFRRGSKESFEDLRYFDVLEAALSAKEFTDNVANTWLTDAFKLSAKETVGAIQAYLSFNSKEITSSDSELMALFSQFASMRGKFKLTIDISYALISSPNIHGYYLGALDGMHSANLLKGMSKAESKLLISKKLREEFKEVCGLPDAADFVPRLRNCILQSAAYVIEQDKV
jgi:hypothetical protein